MLTLLAKILLFLSAYLPLFVIFTINYRQHGWWVLIPLGLSALSCLGILLLLKLVKAANPRPVQIEKVQRKDAEVMAYIVTYVFPFLGLQFDNPASILSLIIFFLVLMLIWINANMVHINPTLNLMGYRLYEVSFDGRQTALITKRWRLLEGSRLTAVIITDELLMEK